jgi:DNA-binding transcriptional MerR regulator
MPYKEKETVKMYYTMGEVSRIFNVNASLIRFYEKEFDIIKPKKNKKGNRLFTPEDLENFKIIHHLVKERGYTLEGARNKLKGNKDGMVNNVELATSLNKVRSFLVELKQYL